MNLQKEDIQTLSQPMNTNTKFIKGAIISKMEKKIKEMSGIDSMQDVSPQKNKCWTDKNKNQEVNLGIDKNFKIQKIDYSTLILMKL